MSVYQTWGSIPGSYYNCTGPEDQQPTHHSSNGVSYTTECTRGETVLGPVVLLSPVCQVVCKAGSTSSMPLPGREKHLSGQKTVRNPSMH